MRSDLTGRRPNRSQTSRTSRIHIEQQLRGEEKGVYVAAAAAAVMSAGDRSISIDRRIARYGLNNRRTYQIFFCFKES